MILSSHLLSMILYAFFISVILALIRKNERKAQIRYAIALFLGMVVGALLFGWFMYLFIF